MNAAISYTVGVKRRFGIFFKKYSVWGHRDEICGDSVRLSLRLSDGGLLVVPDIHRKFVKVYPDYSAAMYHQQKMKESKRAPSTVEDLRDGISEG